MKPMILAPCIPLLGELKSSFISQALSFRSANSPFAFSASPFAAELLLVSKTDRRREVSS